MVWTRMLDVRTRTRMLDTRTRRLDVRTRSLDVRTRTLNTRVLNTRTPNVRIPSMMTLNMRRPKKTTSVIGHNGLLMALSSCKKPQWENLETSYSGALSSLKGVSGFLMQ